MTIPAITRNEEFASILEEYDEIGHADRLRRCKVGHRYAGLKRSGSIRSCQSRLCYGCMQLKSDKRFEEMHNAFRWLVARHDLVFARLTLTIDTTPFSGDIKRCWKALQAAWERLRHRPAFLGSVEGYCRCAETGISKEWNIQPHIHAVILLRKSSIRPEFRTKDSVRSLWKSCLGVSYDPQVGYALHQGTMEGSFIAAGFVHYATKPVKLTWHTFPINFESLIIRGKVMDWFEGWSDVDTVTCGGALLREALKETKTKATTIPAIGHSKKF